MKNSHRSGFTLMELALALGAGATILVAVYGLFSRAVHMRDNATERTREVRVRAHAMSVLRNDLRGARVSGGSMASVLKGSQQGQSGAFPGYLKVMTTTARGLDPADELATADLQQVEYYLATDPASADGRAGLLVRVVDTNPLAPVRNTPPEEPLLGGIESMEITFFDGNDWQVSWDASQDDPTLPQAVRVRLQPAAAEVNARKPPVIEVIVPWTTQTSIDPSNAATPPPEAPSPP